MAARNKDNELYITRIYDAPINLVWDAWVDPVQAAKWWGPRGFTITTHSKDLRVGGSWNYTMHGPDGTDYPNSTIYHEVEKHSCLVYDHGASADRPPMFRVNVSFVETKGKTRMEMIMSFPSAEIALATKKFIKQAGGDATWDRLAEYLAEEIQQKNIFVINRTFEAKPELVYELWSDPKHLAQWLAPTGATAKFLRADIKVGGSTFWRMDSAHGVMFGRASYLEMNRPTRLVYTQQFVDENETISRHPMAPTWPETMLTTVDFSAEDNNKTRVTITWEPYGTTKSEEIDTFKKARSGMTQGWTGSLDKLEEYLSQVR